MKLMNCVVLRINSDFYWRLIWKENYLKFNVESEPIFSDLDKFEIDFIGNIGRMEVMLVNKLCSGKVCLE